MSSSRPHRIKRSRLKGALLRPLGHRYWGAEQSDSEVILLGGAGKAVPFSEMAGPASLSKTLGFSTITLPLRDGTAIKIAGLDRERASRSSAR